jgi:hypothetical protein
VISRRRKLRQTSTGSKQVRPWRPDLNETASTETGLIQFSAFWRLVARQPH